MRLLQGTALVSCTATLDFQLALSVAMPVNLPPPPPNTTPPAVLNPFVWAALFIAIMAIGIGHTLLTWPKGTSTHTVWFWLRLVFFPAMAWLVLLGLRLLYVEQETDRIRAELDQWNEDRDKAVRFAQEPLALLAATYRCGIGCGDVAETIAGGRQTISVQQPSAGLTAIPHTRLVALEGLTLQARYEACFVELLDRLDDALCALPACAPLEVYLQGGASASIPRAPNHVDDKELDAEPVDIFAIWQRCWAGFGHRAAPTHALPTHDSMMTLDTWLDAYAGRELEKFVLIIAVQLHATPPARSAEAAVALLLGWAPLAQRNSLPIDALLHRPVATKDGAVVDRLSTSLLWGRAEAAEVTGLWHAKLDVAIKTEVVKAACDIGMAACRIDGLTGVHDVERALGDAGAAEPWLTLALAAEHAGRTGEAQTVVTCCPTLCMAVAQASMSTHDAGPQG